LTIDYHTDAKSSLLIPGFGEPAQDEFLRQVGCRSLTGINKEVAQEQTDANFIFAVSAVAFPS
jgi:hypothetical protein